MFIRPAYERDVVLNELKQIFDKIETYDDHDNIGFRSLKNLGVWLTAYALTEPSQKEEVINDLQQLAGTNMANLKEKVDFLSEVNVLQTVIRDYEAANGKFVISVKTEGALKRLRAKAAELGYGAIVDNHSAANPNQDPDLLFEMSNIMQFQWSGHHMHEKKKLITGQKHEFSGVGKIKFLTTAKESDVYYNVVQCDNRLYHVARLGALQADAQNMPNNSYAYFIQPSDSRDENHLQTDYFRIIQAFKPAGTVKSLQRLAAQQEKLHGLKMEISDAAKLKNADDNTRLKYDVTFHFPELLGTLKTTETRLGPYAAFESKTIASVCGDLSYRGERELKYDERGGEIKNLESLAIAEMGEMHLKNPLIIHLDYTISGPFMLVYEAPQESDYYAFKITNPTKDLVKEFGNTESYKHTNYP